jgi:hypothetical protein
VQEHKEWGCGVSHFSQITLAHKETLSVAWLFRIGMRLYVAGWVRTLSFIWVGDLTQFSFVRFLSCLASHILSMYLL